MVSGLSTKVKVAQGKSSVKLLEGTILENSSQVGYIPYTGHGSLVNSVSAS